MMRLDEARTKPLDPQALASTLQSIKQERTAPPNEADQRHYKFIELLGRAIQDTISPEQLQHEIERLRHQLQVPHEEAAVDHIRPRKWGGQTEHTNLLVDICRKCNGDLRSFIPFPFWVNGLGGKIEKDAITAQDIFVPGKAPILSETELKIMQTNIAAGLGHMIRDDIRVVAQKPKLKDQLTGKQSLSTSPSAKSSWVKRSFFVSALPNMLHSPTNPLPLDKLPERLDFVFRPLFKRNPEVFLSRDTEEYLISNKRWFEAFVEPLLKTLIYPMRREWQKGKGIVLAGPKPTNEPPVLHQEDKKPA